MAFKLPTFSPNGLYASFGVLKFSDMVHLQNIVLLDKLFRNEMPAVIHSTFAVDFPLTPHTRAHKSGLLDLLSVESTCFGKNSIRHNAIRSWNSIQSLLPTRLVELEVIKRDLKKCLLASY